MRIQPLRCCLVSSRRYGSGVANQIADVVAELDTWRIIMSGTRVVFAYASTCAVIRWQPRALRVTRIETYNLTYAPVVLNTRERLLECAN